MSFEMCSTYASNSYSKENTGYTKNNSYVYISVRMNIGIFSLHSYTSVIICMYVSTTHTHKCASLFFVTHI